MDEKYLEDMATSPTSNDYYFKNIVTKEFAEKDNTWYPYTYEVIRCIDCNKDSGYMAKKWFLIFPISNSKAFFCNKCLY